MVLKCLCMSFFFSHWKSGGIYVTMKQSNKKKILSQKGKKKNTSIKDVCACIFIFISLDINSQSFYNTWRFSLAIIPPRKKTHFNLLLLLLLWGIKSGIVWFGFTSINSDKFDIICLHRKSSAINTHYTRTHIKDHWLAKNTHIATHINAHELFILPETGIYSTWAPF